MNTLNIRECRDRSVWLSSGGIIRVRTRGRLTNCNINIITMPRIVRCRFMSGNTDGNPDIRVSRTRIALVVDLVCRYSY